MDKVRLGRVLGYGARQAARTLASAVDAATAPNPNPPAPTQSARAAVAPPASQLRPASSTSPSAASVLRQAAAVHTNVATTGRHARRSFFAPLQTFSSVILLQVAGTFFAMIAVFLGQGAWRLYEGLHTTHNPADAHRLYFSATACVVFTYFAVSSFIRASRRERR